MKKIKFLFILLGFLGVVKVSAATLDFSSGVGVDLIGNQEYLHYYNLYNNYDNEDTITLLSHNIICEVKSSQIEQCLTEYKKYLEKALKQAGGDTTGLTVSIMKSKDYEDFDEYHGAAGGYFDVSTMTSTLSGKYPVWLQYAQNVNSLTTQAVWTPTTVVEQYQFDPADSEAFDESYYNRLSNGLYINKEIPREQYNSHIVFDWRRSEIKAATDSNDIKFGVRPIIKLKKSNINREAGSFYKVGDYWFQEKNSKIILTASNNAIKITDESVLNVSNNNDNNISKLFSSNNQSVVKSYDINILKANQKIQPNGKVKIKIPVPENVDLSKIKISRVEGNEIINYDFIVEGNYIVFETDHFSNYVISSVKKNTASNVINPKTGDNLYLYIIISISAIFLISITVKKYQNQI